MNGAATRRDGDAKSSLPRGGVFGRDGARLANARLTARVDIGAVQGSQFHARCVVVTRMSELDSILAAIRREEDPNRKNLRVGELVSRCFREIGCDPVVVGGSAVEFYSDGRYVSADVDVCFDGARLPTPREREEIMGRIGNPLGVRRCEVAGVIVDLLGRVETTARTPFQTVGDLKLIQIEDLIAERLLVATVPARDETRLNVAKVLVTLVAEGLIAADREELLRVADSPGYRVGAELRVLLAEAEGKGGAGS